MKLKKMSATIWIFNLFLACMSPHRAAAGGDAATGRAAFRPGDRLVVQGRSGVKLINPADILLMRMADPRISGGYRYLIPDFPYRGRNRSQAIPENFVPKAFRGLLQEKLAGLTAIVPSHDTPLQVTGVVPASEVERLRDLGNKVASREKGGPSSEEHLQKVLAAAFDGNAFLKNYAISAKGGDVGGNDRAGGDGRGGSGGNGEGGGNGGSGGRNGNDGEPLNQLYPRAIFLQDVFQEPASDKTVEYVEKLLDAGVHLVFLTWRPQKGPGSAEEILLSRIKQHRTNPLMVISFNGGKISLHGRAANPKSILEDVGAFSPGHIEAFEAINAKVEKTLKLEKGTLREQGLPSLESAFSYILELPGRIRGKDVPAARAKAVRRYNELLKAAGLPYTMVPHPKNPRAMMTQSMPLRFSLPRVYKALDEQFHGDKLLFNTDKFLILADSRKSPKYTSSFPSQADIQVVGSGDEVEATLGAVLGDRSLPTVSIKLGKLRQYVEYWEPSRRYAPEGESSGGGGFRSGSKGDRQLHQKFAMYTGTVLSQTQAWFFEQVWRGQNQLVGLSALQARLRATWYNPLKYGVYVNKPLAKAMKSRGWKAMQRGYLQYANSYLTNFYMREFGDYSAAAANVQQNMVGLATDRKSLITLEFASGSTRRLYKIHTRIPRVMKLDTAQGRTLTAYSYRTGKETPDDGDKRHAQILAMALLKGHGRKGPDGKWHHGAPDGPVIAKLRVQFEYRSSHRTWEFDPDDFLRLEEGQVVQGPIVQEITSAIERMEADQEYQEYYKEHDEEATKADLAKKKGRKHKNQHKSKKRGRRGA